MKLIKSHNTILPHFTMGKVANGRMGRRKNMCLAIPMTITKIDGNYAIAMANGVETQVNYAMMPDIKLNDKVLVHAGFIIEKLDEEQAREIEETWAEYYAILEKGEVKPG